MTVCAPPGEFYYSGGGGAPQHVRFDSWRKIDSETKCCPGTFENQKQRNLCVKTDNEVKGQIAEGDICLSLVAG